MGSPAMQPGKRSWRAVCQSLALIQLPSWLLAPPLGMGTVSLCFSVTITVLLSTRATSLGSVRANQLWTEGVRGHRGYSMCLLAVWVEPSEEARPLVSPFTGIRDGSKLITCGVVKR